MGLFIIVLILILLMIMVFGFLLNNYFFETCKTVNPKMCHEDYSGQNLKLSFFSGKNELTGYLYGANCRKGLIIISHGMGVISDYYLPEILRFVAEGYMVLSFDNTNYRKNSGRFNGFAQGVKDLSAAIEFAKQWELPITLMGHSMGGYCVCAVLNYSTVSIKNVIAIAGFNRPFEAIKSFIKQNIKVCPTIITYLEYFIQKLYYGKLANLSAVGGINCTNCMVLIAQGLNDAEVKSNSISIYANHHNIVSKNIIYKVFPEGSPATHMGIIRPESNKINEELFGEILRMIE